MKLLLFTVIGRSYRNYTMFDEPIASLVLDSCLAFELQISNRKRRLNDLEGTIDKKSCAGRIWICSKIVSFVAVCKPANWNYWNWIVEHVT